MSGFEKFDAGIGWAIFLMAMVPVVTIILGETIDRLRRVESKYVKFFAIMRAVVLPVVVVFILARFVLNIQISQDFADGGINTGFLYPLIKTLLYITVAYASFVGLSTIGREKNPKAWENRIPGLFKALLLSAVFVAPVILILDAWGIGFGNFARYAAFAVAAIGFALQDALSSVTKGFLLVLDKPFALGDWIEVDGVKGKVIDISWRSTRLQVAGNDIVVIPNLIISDNSVYNYTAEDISYRDELTLGFSYGDPPNKVKAILNGVLEGCPDIMKVPAPRIYTISYDDFSIGYKMYFFIKEYISAMDQERIRDDIMNRVWYAAARGGISIPFPIQVEAPPAAFEPDLVAVKAGIFTDLSDNGWFADLNDDQRKSLAESAKIAQFAAGEIIFEVGDVARSIGLVRRGQVELNYPDTMKQSSDIVAQGGLICEIALMGRRTNMASATAMEDTEILYFSHEIMTPILEKTPRFALRLNALVERRMMHYGTTGTVQ